MSDQPSLILEDFARSILKPSVDALRDKFERENPELMKEIRMSERTEEPEARVIVTNASSRTVNFPSLLVTHARTLDELRQEFVSDLARRVGGLRLEARLETRSRQSLGLGRAISEIEMLIQYWQTVELAGGRSRREARDGERG